ncbi:MAG: hypothetical protein ACRBF0_08760 [Calditrichia bacterium]
MSKFYINSTLLFLFLLTMVSYAQNYTNLDGNYTLEIPKSWHVISSRLQPYDVMLTEKLTDASDNIIISTLGAGVPDDVYERRETLVAKLLETQPGFKATNVQQVSVKGASMDLLIEGTMPSATGSMQYLASYYFTMNDFAYTVGIISSADNAKAAKDLVDEMLLTFRVYL